MWQLNTTANTTTITLEVMGEAWIGFAIPVTPGEMMDAYAIVCLPNSLGLHSVEEVYLTPRCVPPPPPPRFTALDHLLCRSSCLALSTRSRHALSSVTLFTRFLQQLSPLALFTCTHRSLTSFAHFTCTRHSLSSLALFTCTRHSLVSRSSLHCFDLPRAGTHKASPTHPIRASSRLSSCRARTPQQTTSQPPAHSHARGWRKTAHQTSTQKVASSSSPRARVTCLLRRAHTSPTLEHLDSQSPPGEEQTLQIQTLHYAADQTLHCGRALP
jgi:hypothetical protein